MSSRPRLSRPLRLPVISWVALPIALAGCGLDPAPVPPPIAWVGAAEGSDVVVALSERDGVLFAYACGGPATYATHSRWFTGGADGSGAIDLERDGWRIAGEADAEVVTGTLTAPGGEALSFTATAIEDDFDAPAGLFAAADSGCRTGVVVWTGEDGEPSVQGTWCDDAGHFEQVTPVLPVELTAKGIRVRVDLSALGLGERELHAARFPAR